MYSIGHVIYGVPLTEDIHRAFEEADHEEVWGFETFYDGSASSQPGFLGVELVEFNAFGDVPLWKIAVDPTEEQLADAHAKIERFKADFKAETGKDIKLGKIDTWVVWSTS